MSYDALTSIGLRPAFFVPLIILATLTLATILLLVKGYRVRAASKASGYRLWEYDGDNWRMGGWFCLIFAVCMLVTTVLMLMPYEWKYFEIYRVSGQVTSVSNVFEDASGAITGEPILQLDTLPVAVSVDNQRAVNLEGKDVTLTCTLNWRYAAADRLSCDIYEVAP